MSRRCSSPGCENPGLVYVRHDRYVCERHADELRAELAAATAMAEPLMPAEIEQRDRQLAASHSLTDIYPELRDPAVLSEQIRLWRQVEEDQ